MFANVSIFRQLGAITYDSILMISWILFVNSMIFMLVNIPVRTELVYLISLISLYGYFSWSWVKGRQTLGMKAWHFQITNSEGGNINYQQATTRFILAGTLLVFFGLLYALINPNKQSFQSQYSKTKLIKLNK
jgi:uncharacterized RDD family membrane protein YckC